MKNKLQKLLPCIVALNLLIIWELLVRINKIPLYLLPAPSKVALTLCSESKILAYHGAVTVMEAMAGMILAIVLGVSLGILMDAFPLFKKSIYPILVVTQTIPVIVLAPIFIIYLGFGWAPKILTVVLMCFFPIVISFSDGMTELNVNYTNLVKSYGASKRQLYSLVKLPAAMNSLISGLKVSATYSISGAVVGEWIGAGSGLGYYMIKVKNGYMMDKVFACVAVIILLSLLMNGLIHLLQYIFMPYLRKQKKKGERK